MSDKHVSADPGDSTDRSDWQEVERLLDEIADLSSSDHTPAEFHAAVLDRLVRATAASGGAVWSRDQDRLRLDYQVHFDQPALHTTEAGARQHASLVHEVFETARSKLVLPGAGDGRVQNPTECLLLMHPVVIGQRAVAVVELFQRGDLAPDVIRGHERIVSTACELACDFHRDLRLREFTRREVSWTRYREFSLGVHCSLDLPAAAMAIVNETRRFLECDRVSVAVRRGKRYEVLAVSGVDAVHRRSNSVRGLEGLLRMAMLTGEPLYFPEQKQALPPQLDSRIEAYIDTSHARWLALLPLRNPSANSPLAEGPAGEDAAPIGALVVEQFESPGQTDLASRCEAAGEQAASALANAWEYRSLPFSGLLRPLRGCLAWTRLEHLPKSLAVLGLLLVIGLCLVLIPGELKITARGELQPQRRQHVFAPSDGIVTELAAPNVTSVRRQQVLAVLRNPRLDRELGEVTGRRSTVVEQLDAVRAARMRNDPASAGATDAADLSSQEEQLAETLKGLDAELKVLLQQQKELRVQSPMDGEILTWDLARRLISRPVQRGELLLTVADLSGPWELELRIDDADAGHVVEAWEASGGDLQVEFRLASDPGQRYTGRLTRLADATDLDPSNVPVLSATVALENANIQRRRPGASVVAWIRCGQRSIGFVWFRQIIEAVQTRLPF